MDHYAHFLGGNTNPMEDIQPLRSAVSSSVDYEERGRLGGVCGWEEGGGEGVGKLSLTISKFPIFASVSSRASCGTTYLSSFQLETKNE